MAALKPWMLLRRAVRRLRGMLPFGARPEPPSVASVDPAGDAADSFALHVSRAENDEKSGASSGPWWARPQSHPAVRPDPGRESDRRGGEPTANLEALRDTNTVAVNLTIADRAKPPRASQGGAAIRRNDAQLPPASPPPPPQVDSRDAVLRKFEQMLDRARPDRHWITLDPPDAFRRPFDGLIHETDAVLDSEAALAFAANGGAPISGLRISGLVRALGLAAAVELSREFKAKGITFEPRAPFAARIIDRLAELGLMARP